MAKRDSVPGIGELLRNARKNKGFTGLDVETITGISPTTISLYETEEKTPGVAVLRRLAAAYGVSVADLVPKMEQYEAKNKKKPSK